MFREISLRFNKLTVFNRQYYRFNRQLCLTADITTVQKGFYRLAKDMNTFKQQKDHTDYIFSVEDIMPFLVYTDHYTLFKFYNDWLNVSLIFIRFFRNHIYTSFKHH